MSDVAVLQKVLAGEHAAVYAYGIVGAHVTGTARARARSAYDGHRARRDQLVRLIADRKATPVASAAAYQLPRAVTDAGDAALLATEVEERVAAVWDEAVGALGGDLRVLAARALQDTAVRAAAWRGGSVPFPGLAQAGLPQPH